MATSQVDTRWIVFDITSNDGYDDDGNDTRYPKSNQEISPEIDIY